MGKSNRWMTWVLEESARTDVTMPWARGVEPNWQSRLAHEAPGLAKILSTPLSDDMGDLRVAGMSR
ncbi:hypothetical protein [uncultured Litoreibacter sp.]|uniref:hypothetical protein n=1 Tax=uncultured Litoreibacter sp. TaxID=1392394 RepID=UPI00260EF5BF|nr:hypothetical protein [uncultured Litoreibacter sp.]